MILSLSIGFSSARQSVHARPVSISFLAKLVDKCVYGYIAMAKCDSIYARLECKLCNDKTMPTAIIQRFSITLFTVQHLFSASILAIRREMFWLILYFLSGSGKCETTALRVTLQLSFRFVFVRSNRIWIKEKRKIFILKLGFGTRLEFLTSFTCVNFYLFIYFVMEKYI